MNLLYTLRRAKELHANRIAMYDGDRTITYAEFANGVARSANCLRDLGIGRRDRIAALMLNRPTYLELYHATVLAGAIIVPINIRWNLDDMVFCLSDSGTRLLVLDDYFAHLWPSLHAALPQLECLFAGDGLCPEGMASYRARMNATTTQVPDDPDPAEDDVAGLFYTSGTTGGPKGVALTHGNLWATALYCTVTFDMNPDWIWLHAAPMFHLADALVVYSAVMHGAGNCFVPTFDPEACLQAIERYRVTHTILVPAMLNSIVNHPSMGRYDVSSLRYILYGASPMPLDLLRRARQKLGCQFAQVYGLSEAGPLLTFLAPEDHIFEDAEKQWARVKSAGRPILGVEVKVVDALDREVARGEIGEVVGRGSAVMKGYWNEPAITAETLRGGWLHSGDMGVMDADGYLHIRDRKKDMIKPGGENVYSPEVEAVIASHPDVLEVAVIGVPDEKWGEAIKAVVVKRPGGTLTDLDLIDYCRQRMTHFKCPTSVDFLEALPKGGTGKLQKNVLRERYVQDRVPYRAPQTKGSHK